MGSLKEDSEFFYRFIGVVIFHKHAMLDSVSPFAFAYLELVSPGRQMACHHMAMKVRCTLKVKPSVTDFVIGSQKIFTYLTPSGWTRNIRLDGQSFGPARFVHVLTFLNENAQHIIGDHVSEYLELLIRLWRTLAYRTRSYLLWDPELL